MQPVPLAERISVLDSLRGFALLGVLTVNIAVLSGPAQYILNLAVKEEFSGPNYWVWWAVNGLFEGNMRGIFSLLFGAGSLLLLGRLEAKKPGLYAADIFYRRMIVLMLFGMLNGYFFLWHGDILFAYGFCGLFLFPFRNWKPGWLLVLAGVCLAIWCGFSTLEAHKFQVKKQEGLAALALEKNGAALTEGQTAAKKKWVRFTEQRKLENLRKKARENIAKVQGSYGQTFALMRSWTLESETSGMYSDTFWDVLWAFFAGMALFKWGILTGKKSLRFYLVTGVLGLGVGLPLNIWFHQVMIEVKFVYTAMQEVTVLPLYELKRIPTVLGMVGVFMAAYKSGWFGAAFRWLGKVGQMAFTNYLCQSVICICVFYGFGLGLYGQLERYEIYEIVAAIWVFQILFSNVWLRYFRFGPFEWVWRSLTYWQRQPMVRERGRSGVAA